MEEKYTIEHGIRKSELVSVTSPRQFGGERGIMHTVDLVFANNDNCSYFSSNIAEVLKFKKGDVYFYQLVDTITTDREGNKNVKTRFNWHTLVLPYKVQSQMKYVDEIHLYIKRSAELSMQSFAGSVMGFDETQFKERAFSIYDWMKSTLMAEDFGDSEGLAFDERSKNFVNK